MSIHSDSSKEQFEESYTRNEPDLNEAPTIASCAWTTCSVK